MFGDDLRHVMPFVIPILALLIPIVAVVAHYVSKTHRDRERHETIRQLVKAGQPVPSDLLRGPDFKDSDYESRENRKSRNYYLQAGVVNTAIGLGLMGMFIAMRPSSWLWAIGLIPVCLGLGFLLLWNIERKQRESGQP